MLKLGSRWPDIHKFVGTASGSLFVVEPVIATAVELYLKSAGSPAPGCQGKHARKLQLIGVDSLHPHVHRERSNLGEVRRLYAAAAVQIEGLSENTASEAGIAVPYCVVAIKVVIGVVFRWPPSDAAIAHAIVSTAIHRRGAQRERRVGFGFTDDQGIRVHIVIGGDGINMHRPILAGGFQRDVGWEYVKGRRRSVNYVHGPDHLDRVIPRIVGGVVGHAVAAQRIRVDRRSVDYCRESGVDIVRDRGSRLHVGVPYFHVKRVVSQ